MALGPPDLTVFMGEFTVSRRALSTKLQWIFALQVRSIPFRTLKIATIAGYNSSLVAQLGRAFFLMCVQLCAKGDAGGTIDELLHGFFATCSLLSHFFVHPVRIQKRH